MMVFARRLRQPISQPGVEQEELFGWRPTHRHGRRPKTAGQIAGQIKVCDCELVPFSSAEKEGGSLLQALDFGLKEARWLLDHAFQIPCAWREFILVFPGSSWITPDGKTAVPYLIWWSWCDRWQFAYGDLEALLADTRSRVVQHI